MHVFEEKATEEKKERIKKTLNIVSKNCDFNISNCEIYNPCHMMINI